MASIIYDAALSARENPAMRISYSRTKAFYAMAGRYDGTDYGYDTVVPAVDALVAKGLLVDHDKVKGVLGGTGVQSSFRPAPGLADLVLPRPDYRVGEIIRLKDSNGALVGYRDTERTARDRRSLEAVNRHIANADIRLAHINGVTVDEDAGTIFFPGFLQWLDEGFGDHTVYTRMNALYRVYNGGWALGGRFYGGWWQQVRGCDRQHLLIDGAETVEHDYEMLHPRLLYASSGQKLAGDAYTLDGWDRKVCKRVFNILLNTNTYKQALGAIRPYVGNNRKAAAVLIAEMKKRHAPIASSFHSVAGLRLQNVDAEMVKSVLRDLTLREGITVLPIHDSFVVQKEHETTLEAAMDEALARATSCVGDRPTVSKGWSGIYPHRENTSGAGVVQNGATLAQPDPTRPLAAPLSGSPPHQVATDVSDLALVSDRASIPFGILPTPMSETHNRSSRRAETVVQPLQAHTPDEAQTAHGALLLSDAGSDTGEPENVVGRPLKALQSANRNLTPSVDPVMHTKTVSPPAFLNPANRGRGLTEELKRLAGRPLNDRPTIDHLGRRKR
ncbi:MAG: hypothetical protein E5Y31_11275 [Mesorhizobium sp.]|nr:MAG: hypothetical protein E5Y31_11275 [Mesorhizobium sp.]